MKLCARVRRLSTVKEVKGTSRRRDLLMHGCILHGLINMVSAPFFRLLKRCGDPLLSRQRASMHVRESGEHLQDYPSSIAHRATQ